MEDDGSGEAGHGGGGDDDPHGVHGDVTRAPGGVYSQPHTDRTYVSPPDSSVTTF